MGQTTAAPGSNLDGLVDTSAVPIGENTLPFIERARRYIATMPAAISGQGGHNATFRVACECAKFNVTSQQAWELLNEYNARCLPPWSQKELEHKLKDGFKAVEGEGRYGCRIDEPAPTWPASWGVADKPIEATPVIAESPTPAPVKTGQDKPTYRGIKTVRMSEVTPEDVAWLWTGRIAIGCLTIVAGPASVGKGLLTADITARVTTARDWPDGSKAVIPAGDVLLISGEDDPKRVIAPRLTAARADLSRVIAGTTIERRDDYGKPYLDGFTLADLPGLRATVEEHGGVKVVIIDPIGSFVGGRIDSDKDNAVRAVLAPIATLAEEKGIAIIIVAHYRKADASSADDRVMGSRGFTAISRNVWHVLPEPETGRRLFLSGKANLAKPPAGLAFIPEGIPVAGLRDTVPVATWQNEAIEQTADEWISAQAGETTRGPKPVARKEAESFLKSAINGGIRIAAELIAEALAAGISESTLSRARASLGIMTAKTPDGHIWFEPITNLN